MQSCWSNIYYYKNKVCKVGSVEKNKTNIPNNNNSNEIRLWETERDWMKTSIDRKKCNSNTEYDDTVARL